MSWNILVTIVGIFLTLSASSPLGPNETEERNFKGYTECLTQDDCPRGYCCTLGMQRYSLPTCSPLGLKEDPCIPHNPKSRNFSLSYPNRRSALEIRGVYLLLCPCDRNYACDRERNSCQEPRTLNYKSLDKTDTPNDI